MGNFSIAGYFFTYLMIFVHKKCKVSQKRFERLAVFVKIVASRNSYLFLQQTVTNPIMSKNKASKKFENLQLYAK